MKTWEKILAIITAILLIAAFFVFDSFYIAPQRITTRRTDITDERIPPQMDGVQILFFADLDYGTFVNDKRVQKLVDHINSLSPDVVIFGGDIYDTDAVPNENSNELLSSMLRQIKAPLGKFAVLGDSDTRDEETAGSMITLLNAGGFEVLRNKSITLHNTGSQYITLTGLDNGLDGFDAEAGYSEVSRSSYVMTICHTPDSALQVPSDLTDYFLAAHSHGGQVWYFFGSLYTQPMAEYYMRGKHKVDDSFILDISSGTGTRQQDVRFLSNSEVAVYTLHSLSVVEEEHELQSEAPEESEEDQTEDNAPPSDEETDIFSEAYGESDTFEYNGGEETPQEEPEEPQEEAPAEPEPEPEEENEE